MTAEEAQNLSDKELVRLALEKRDDFLYLVNRYKPKLSRYIRRLTKVDEEGIEDLLQEIFIKIYLNLNDFDDKLQFSSWAYRIAHNQVISGFRKFKARPEGHAVNIDDQGVMNLAAQSDIVGDIDRRLAADKVREALAALDSRHREVLVLKFLEDKSYQEISDILEKPAGTVASLLNKSKKELRRLIEKQGKQ